MSTEPVLLQPFDYKPCLEIQGGGSFTVGFVPTYSNLAIVDTHDRRFRLACPPAMMLVKMDLADEINYGSMARAISLQSLEIVARVMMDFRHRPATLLRGVSLATRGVEPTSEAKYIALLGDVLAKGDPVAIQSSQFLDLSDSISENLRGAALLKGAHGAEHRERVERGICMLREAAERDAKTAMSTISGEKRDFERELRVANRGEIEGLLAASARRSPYGSFRDSPVKVSESNFNDKYVMLSENPLGRETEPGEPDLEDV